MRHVLQGVVGAGLLYPVLWYFVSQGMDQANAPPALQARTAPAVTRGGTEQTEPSTLAGHIPSARGTERSTDRMVRSEAPSSTASVEHLPSEPVRSPSPPTVVEPQVAAPTEPTVPVPLPPGLPKMLSRVADVQSVASDPTALADRVQKFQASPEELTQLKAFAEQFVQLPPSSADFDLSGMPPAKGHTGTVPPHER
jgi:hypothetical protein